MNKHKKIHAILWMLGAIVSLSLIAISARELSTYMSPFEMLSIRSAIGLVILIIVILLKKQKQLFVTTKIKTHFVRHSIHFLSQYAWFIGLGILPLAHVFALEFTTPLWTILIASILLHEKITSPKMVALVMGIIGVVVILRPDVHAFEKESLIVLVAAFGFAITHIQTKQLSTTDDVLTILFYMCLIQLPWGLVLSINDLVIPVGTQWIWLLLMGITGLTANYCIASALKIAEAGLVVSLDFFRLPMIAIVGVLFYAEKFDINIIIGGVLIVAGNWYVHYKTNARAVK
jgi:drug/metabolite transporter (DMT)-like permease